MQITCPNCRKEVRTPPPPERSPPEPPITPRRPNTELFTMSDRTPIFNNYVYTRIPPSLDSNATSVTRRIRRYEEQYLVRRNPRHPDD